MPATIAMAPQDELLRLTGVTGNPFEDVSTTNNGVGRYYGANKGFRARLVVAWAVTGTNPTLDVKFQDSADGVTYADMGYSFTQVTASNAVATLSLSAFPLLAVMTAAGRPWVRVVKTIGGTASPTFGSVAVLHEPAEPF